MHQIINLGSLQRSPDPLAGSKGPTSKERGKEAADGGKVPLYVIVDLRQMCDRANLAWYFTRSRLYWENCRHFHGSAHGIFRPTCYNNCVWRLGAC